MELEVFTLTENLVHKSENHKTCDSYSDVKNTNR